MAACPCGTGEAFAECCRPALRGERPAATAEALMRSRYTAYVRRDLDYLLRTWDEADRPADLALDGVTWLGLEVLSVTGGGVDDARGTVTFVAHYEEASGTGTLRETSRFERRDGEWVYVDGDVS